MKKLITICEDGVRTNKRLLIFWYVWLGAITGMFIWALITPLWWLTLLSAANIIFIIWQIRVTYRQRDEWQTKADSYKRGIYPTI